MMIQSVFRTFVIIFFTSSCVLGVHAFALAGVSDVICSGASNPAGLAQDVRGNIYTADKQNGHVICIPQGAEPVLLGEVAGIPSAVAVDRLRNVFVGTESGMVYRVSLGRAVMKVYHSESGIMGLTVDRDGGLFIASDGGTVVKVNRRALIGQDE